MSINTTNKVQFSLKIEKMEDTANKVGEYHGYEREPKEPVWEAYETLDFKSLSAVEVVRKVLDYLRTD